MAEPSDIGTNTTNEQLQHSVFAGTKLWFSRKCPMRPYLEQQATLNGAIIVKQDKEADMIIADHAKKEIPPGSYSFKFVEASIRDGKMQDPEEYRATVTIRAVRPVGSIRTAAKGTRNAFSPEDDQILRDFVQPVAEAGGSWKGNQIYFQLARLHPHHTAQSWRDRFLKKVVNRSRIPGVVSDDVDDRPVKRRRVEDENGSVDNVDGNAQDVQTEPIAKAKFSAESTQPRHEVDSRPAPQKLGRRRERETRKEARNSAADDEVHTHVIAENSTSPALLQAVNTHGFTKEDLRQLFKALPWIVATANDKVAKAWRDYASHRREIDLGKGRKPHTVADWRRLYEFAVLPEYMRRHNLVDEDELHAHVNKVLSKGEASDGDKSRISADVDEDESEGNVPSTAEHHQKLQELARARREEEIELSSISSISEDETAADEIECANCHEKNVIGQAHHSHNAYCGLCQENLAMANKSDIMESPPKVQVRRQKLERSWHQSSPQQASVDPNSEVMDGRHINEPESPSFVLLSPTAQHFTDPRANEGRKRTLLSQSTATNSNSQPSQSHLSVQHQVASPTDANETRTAQTLSPRSSTKLPAHAPGSKEQPSAPYSEHQGSQRTKEDQTTSQSRQKKTNVSQEPPESGQRLYVDMSATQKSTNAHFETAQEIAEDRPYSPMFFSADEESDDDAPRSQHPKNSDLVHLFDADDMVSIATGSGYAPSDTGSEFMHFDESPERHQLWQASKDRELQAAVSQASEEEGGEEEEISETLQTVKGRISTPRKPDAQSSMQQLGSNQVSVDMPDVSDSGDDKFETAVQKQSDRLETQAILNQPMEDLHDLSVFDLPEPEGGWDHLGIEHEADDFPEIRETPRKNPPTQARLFQSPAQSALAFHQAMQQNDVFYPTPRARAYSPDAHPNMRPEASPTKARRISSSPRTSSERSSLDVERDSTNKIKSESTNPNASNLASESESESEFDIEPRTQTNRGQSSTNDNNEQADDDIWYDEQISLHTKLSRLPMTVIHPIVSAAYLASSVNMSLAGTVIPLMIESYKSHSSRHGWTGNELLSEAQAKTLVPSGFPGVWTEKDDSRLMSRNKADIHRMEHKHGEESCELRVKFLRAWSSRQ